MTNVFHWPERRGHDHMEECERWADTLKPRYKETAHLQTAVMVYQPERRKRDGQAEAPPTVESIRDGEKRMACTGNCDQGRRCTCAPRTPDEFLPWLTAPRFWWAYGAAFAALLLGAHLWHR